MNAAGKRRELGSVYLFPSDGRYRFVFYVIDERTVGYDFLERRIQKEIMTTGYTKLGDCEDFSAAMQRVLETFRKDREYAKL